MMREFYAFSTVVFTLATIGAAIGAFVLGLVSGTAATVSQALCFVAMLACTGCAIKSAELTTGEPQ